MESVTTTDVIIIGAGPTGLALACQLARYEVDFIIIEKAVGVTAFSKALGVHARTLEIYEQLGLAQKAIEQGSIAGKVRLLEAGQIRGEVDLSNVGQGLSQYPYMLVLEQNKNEQILYEYLQAAGKDVCWQTEFENLSQNESIVSIEVKTASGESETIKAKYLVGCDGPKSAIRHQLGLGFEGSTFERLFYVADAQIDWAFPHDALQICLSRNGVVAFFPMKGDRRYRIVGAFPEGIDKDEGEVLYEEIERQIKTEAEITLEISHVLWFSTYKVHTRRVENFQSGRCFLAGDSAHVHTPAGGQGMNTGIQDGYNLAWKLALVLKGEIDPKILETYNDERLENAKNLLVTTDRIFQLGANPDWLLVFIRTTVLPPLAKYILAISAVKKRFFALISQIGINYRHQVLSQHEGDAHFKIKAGDRMPYFQVDEASVYDCLREPKFHLLTFSHNLTGNQATRDQTPDDYRSLIDFHAFTLNTQIEEIFGTNEPFKMLLRPDNYIALISPETSANDLQAYLNQIKSQ